MRKNKSGTPCINECLYNSRLGFCESCGRTMNEISNWTRYSDKMKADINRKAKDRLELL